MRSKSLLDQLISVGKASTRGLDATSQPLSENELAERKLAIAVRDGVEESYVHFSAPVLERVQLRGVHHQVVSYGECSIIAAKQLDPRFAQDAKFPNQWRPLKRTTTGGFAEGDASRMAAWAST